MNILNFNTEMSLFSALIELSKTFVFKNNDLLESYETLRSATESQKAIKCLNNEYKPFEEEKLLYFQSQIENGIIFNEYKNLKIFSGEDFNSETDILFDSELIDVTKIYVKDNRDYYLLLNDFLNKKNNTINKEYPIEIQKEQIKRLLWENFEIIFVYTNLVAKSYSKNIILIDNEKRKAYPIEFLINKKIVNFYKEENYYLIDTVQTFINKYNIMISTEELTELYLRCREKKEFSVMLYYNKDKYSDNVILPEKILNNFLKEVESTKEYFMRNIYNRFFGYTYERYFDFVTFMIVLFSIKRFLGKDFIKFEKYNRKQIKNLLASYGIFNLDEIPEDYTLKLIENIDKFFRKKGTNEVFQDILNIFDIDRLEIKKYILVKRNKSDYYKDPETKMIINEKYKIYSPEELEEKNQEELEEILLSFKKFNKNIYLSEYIKIVKKIIEERIIKLLEEKTFEELKNIYENIYENNLLSEDVIKNDLSKFYNDEFNLFLNNFLEGLNEQTALAFLLNANKEFNFTEFLKDYFVEMRLQMISNNLNNSSFNIFQDQEYLQSQSKIDLTSSIERISNELVEKYLMIYKDFQRTEIKPLKDAIDKSLEPIFTDELFPYPYEEIKNYLYNKLIEAYKEKIEETQEINEVIVLYSKYEFEDFIKVDEQTAEIKAANKYGERSTNLEINYKIEDEKFTIIKNNLLERIKEKYKDVIKEEMQKKEKELNDKKQNILNQDIIKQNANKDGVTPGIKYGIDDSDENKSNFSINYKEYPFIKHSYTKIINNQNNENVYIHFNNDIIPIDEQNYDQIYENECSIKLNYSSVSQYNYIYFKIDKLSLTPSVKLEYTVIPPNNDYDNTGGTGTGGTNPNTGGGGTNPNTGGGGTNPNTGGGGTNLLPSKIEFSKYIKIHPKDLSGQQKDFYEFKITGKDFYQITCFISTENYNDEQSIENGKNNKITTYKIYTYRFFILEQFEINPPVINLPTNNEIVTNLFKLNLDFSSTDQYIDYERIFYRLYSIDEETGNEKLISFNFDNTFFDSNSQWTLFTQSINLTPGKYHISAITYNLLSSYQISNQIDKYINIIEKESKISPPELIFKEKTSNKLIYPTLIGDKYYFNTEVKAEFEFINNGINKKIKYSLFELNDKNEIVKKHDFIDYDKTKPLIFNEDKKIYIIKYGIFSNNDKLLSDIITSKKIVIVTKCENPRILIKRKYVLKKVEIDSNHESGHKALPVNFITTEKIYLFEDIKTGTLFDGSQMVLCYRVVKDENLNNIPLNTENEKHKINRTLNENFSNLSLNADKDGWVKVSGPIIVNREIHMDKDENQLETKLYGIYQFKYVALDLEKKINDSDIFEILIDKKEFDGYNYLRIDKDKRTDNDDIYYCIITNIYNFPSSDSPNKKTINPTFENIRNNNQILGFPNPFINTIKYNKDPDDMNSATNCYIPIGSHFPNTLRGFYDTIDVKFPFIVSQKIEKTGNMFLIDENKFIVGQSKNEPNEPLQVINGKNYYFCFDLIEKGEHEKNFYTVLEIKNDYQIRNDGFKDSEIPFPSLDDENLYILPDNKPIADSSSSLLNNVYTGSQLIKMYNYSLNYGEYDIYYILNDEYIKNSNKSDENYKIQIKNNQNFYSEKYIIDEPLRIEKTTSIYAFIKKNIEELPISDIYKKDLRIKLPDVLISPKNVNPNSESVDIMALVPDKIDKKYYSIIYTKSESNDLPIDPIVSLENFDYFDESLTITKATNFKFKLIPNEEYKEDFIEGNIIIRSYNIKGKTIENPLTLDKLTDKNNNELKISIALAEIENEFLKLDIMKNLFYSKYIQDLKNELENLNYDYKKNYIEFLVDLYKQKLYNLIKNDNQVNIRERIYSFTVTPQEKETIDNDILIKLLEIIALIKTKEYTEECFLFEDKKEYIFNDFKLTEIQKDYFNLDEINIYKKNLVNILINNFLENNSEKLNKALEYVSLDFKNQEISLTEEKINIYNYYKLIVRRLQISVIDYDSISYEHEEFVKLCLINKILELNPDYNEGKSLYFVSIPLFENNIEKIFKSLKFYDFIPFGRITISDKYWKATEDEVKSQDFNYALTKYISINNKIYNIERCYEFAFLFDTLIRLKLKYPNRTVQFPIFDSIINFVSIENENNPTPVEFIDILLGINVLLNHYFKGNNDRHDLNLKNNLIFTLNPGQNDYYMHEEFIDDLRPTAYFPKKLDNNETTVVKYDKIPELSENLFEIDEIKIFFDWLENLFEQKRNIEKESLKIESIFEYRVFLEEYKNRYRRVIENEPFGENINIYDYLSSKQNYQEYVNFLFSTFDSEENIDYANNVEKLKEFKLKRYIYLTDLLRDYINNNKYDDIIQGSFLVDKIKDILLQIFDIFKFYSTKIISGTSILVSNNPIEGNIKMIDNFTNKGKNVFRDYFNNNRSEYERMLIKMQEKNLSLPIDYQEIENQIDRNSNLNFRDEFVIIRKEKGIIID
jgi:hypothetical protein